MFLVIFSIDFLHKSQSGPRILGNGNKRGKTSENCSDKPNPDAIVSTCFLLHTNYDNTKVSFQHRLPVKYHVIFDPGHLTVNKRTGTRTYQRNSWARGEIFFRGPIFSKKCWRPGGGEGGKNISAHSKKSQKNFSGHSIKQGQKIFSGLTSVNKGSKKFFFRTNLLNSNYVGKTLFWTNICKI